MKVSEAVEGFPASGRPRRASSRRTREAGSDQMCPADQGNRGRVRALGAVAVGEEARFQKAVRKRRNRGSRPTPLVAVV